MTLMTGGGATAKILRDDFMTCRVEKIHGNFSLKLCSVFFSFHKWLLSPEWINHVKHISAKTLINRFYHFCS